MENEQKFNERLNTAIDDLKEYLNLRLRLIQLNLAEKISIALANLISSLIATVFFVLFFLFGSFALAYWIGTSLGSTALGFAIIAGIYFLFAVIILVFAKKSIRRNLTNSFISEFTDDNSNN